MIVIDNIDVSKWFVDLYYCEVIEYFMNPINVYGDYMLSKIIKIALDKSILNLTDLLKTDKEVLNILENSNDKEISNLLIKINSNIVLIEDKEEFDIHQTFKPRIIDPDILINNKICKSSNICEDIKNMNKIAYDKMIEGIY